MIYLILIIYLITIPISYILQRNRIRKFSGEWLKSDRLVVLPASLLSVFAVFMCYRMLPIGDDNEAKW